MSRYTSAFRERMVREFRRSGLTQREFARRHDLKLTTLRTWIYKRHRKTDGGSARLDRGPVRLLPVKVRQPPVEAPLGAIEAALPAGVWLRFPVGTDCSYLAQLLSAITHG